MLRLMQALSADPVSDVVSSTVTRANMSLRRCHRVYDSSAILWCSPASEEVVSTEYACSS